MVQLSLLVIPAKAVIQTSYILYQIPLTMTHVLRLSSWPALCRPSTSLPHARAEYVDGRATPGDDD
jgi:hypothetical protein